MDPILAFSLQDEVEKYGAYVGIGAFLGLAVLTLLFFAQARELKRLRDWAGRAPERAQEIEARAIAQAEEALKPTPAPAPQPVEQPTVAVPSGNGRQAAKPALVPMGPRPAVAAAALAAWPGTKPPAVEEESAEAEPATAVPAAAAPAAAPPHESAGAAAPPAGGDSSAAAPPPSAPPDRDSSEADAPPSPPPAGAPPSPPAAAPAPAKPTENGTGEKPAVVIPRATPRPAPRRVPAQPARATGARSTTLPRRAGTVPGRRPVQQAEGSGAARIALFAVLGVLVLGGVAFAGTQIFAGEEEPEPAPNRATETAGGPSSGSTDGGSDRAAAARPETVVVVLNGTPASGLAADRGEKLIAEGYSDEPGMVRTGNNTDQQRQDSIVLFRSGERRQARDVATILDIDTIESIDPETQAFADLTDETGRDLTADVTVILGLDQTP